MEETIRYRRQELAKGRVEVGDAVPREALDVFQLDPARYIIPDTKTENKVLYKARMEYNDYSTFIDTE